MMAATKDDAGKARVDLIPPQVLLEVGDVLRFGAEKYNDDDFERDLEFRRIYASVLRHLLKWWSRERMDEESGLPHLAHALAQLMRLRELERRKYG